MKAFLFVFLFSVGVLGQTYKVNAVINGDMGLDQRLSATTAITLAAGVSAYSVDRFKVFYQSITIGAGTTQQITIPNTTAPYKSGFIYANQVKATTTGFSHTDASFSRMQALHVIESYSAQPFFKKTGILSFWMKINKAAGSYPLTFCATIQVPDATNSIALPMVVSTNNTWAEYSLPINFATGLTFPAPSNGPGIIIGWNLAGGTSYTTPTGNTWVATARFTPSCYAHLPILSSANDTFEITGVRLTEGTQKLPFVRAGGGPIAAELALAQRYYEKSFDLGTRPAQNSGTFRGAQCYAATGAGVVSNIFTIPFKVRKRAISSTITAYNIQAANAAWRNTSLAADSGVANVDFSTAGISEYSFHLQNPQVAGDRVGDSICIQWTAESEL